MLIPLRGGLGGSGPSDELELFIAAILAVVWGVVGLLCLGSKVADKIRDAREARGER